MNIDIPDHFEQFLRVKAEIHGVTVENLILCALAQCYPMKDKNPVSLQTVKTLTQVKIRREAEADDVFIQNLRSNPVYELLHIDSEIERMKTWLSIHPGRKLTRKFIINWLNKAMSYQGVLIKEKSWLDDDVA